MSSPITSNPTFTDGIAAITDSLVTCLNNSVDYIYSDDGIGEKAMHVAHDNPAGEAIGSHTQATGRYEGPISLQLLNASDALPRPGYVLTFRSGYYIISGDIGPSRKKDDVVRIKPNVVQAINPVITTLLSTDGQMASSSKAGASSTFANTVANTRAGGTGTWALVAWTEEYPVAAVPSGLTISSSTGLITLNTVSAGTYYLKITYTEVVTGKPNHVGVGHLILTAT